MIRVAREPRAVNPRWARSFPKWCKAKFSMSERTMTCYGFEDALPFRALRDMEVRYFFPAFAARSCSAIVTTRSISSQGAGFPVQISNCRAAWCTNISIPGMI